jgi:hypothetical protein
MKATYVMAAALFGLLLFAGQAAADGAPQESPGTVQEDCPVFEVLLYYPYVAVYPQCLTPPGQG